MQHAWLGFDTGFWLLLTDCHSRGEGVVRTWVDKTAALSELADEGWTISAPYTKRHRSQVDPRLRFRGCALTRTIQ
jgi:hypothetical protein